MRNGMNNICCSVCNFYQLVVMMLLVPTVVETEKCCVSKTVVLRRSFEKECTAIVGRKQQHELRQLLLDADSTATDESNLQSP